MYLGSNPGGASMTYVEAMQHVATGKFVRLPNWPRDRSIGLSATGFLYMKTKKPLKCQGFVAFQEERDSTLWELAK